MRSEAVCCCASAKRDVETERLWFDSRPGNNETLPCAATDTTSVTDTSKSTEQPARTSKKLLLETDSKVASSCLVRATREDS